LELPGRNDWSVEVGYDGGRKIWSIFMSQLNEAKQLAQELADGLFRLGPDRVAALSVHVSKDLIAELEQKAKKLVAQLEAAE
jgi:hypothetical protein